MKVHFYLADITFTGGIEKITTTLANYFVNHGIEVVIVSNFRTNVDFSYELDKKVQTVFLSEKKYSGKPGSFERIKNFLENKKKVFNYFCKLHDEIIIIQSFPNAFLYSLAMGTKNRNKIINVEHVHYFYYNKFLRILRYFVYKKYNNVCVLTNADRLQYEKLNIKATCIPNAIEFSNTVESNEKKVRDKIILGVGRLEEQKNFKTLINVFYKIHKNYPDWKLEIYGKGTLFNTLQNQIKELDLQDSAFLMGVSSEIYKVFKKSAMFVLSSLYEGFPMVLCEAMQNGCPVVSYDCPNGPADLIQNDKNGLLVENQNEEKLYAAIIKLIENSELREEFSKNAYIFVQKYCIENVFNQWKLLFEELGEKS